ncbi:MAG TPA: 2,3-bisphosphoglycerate-independent phosphoglycerate mutase, partial [Elusimicrobiales bacterium]|nr:2,3-bisphosphoglycerate-independent phosphoglycerate mutase [Elusimicrobiales bacterium]
MSLKPVVLLVRDGWGQCPPSKFNAVSNAKTPNMSSYWNEYPHALLDASGEAVGLPAGYQGSSEVGHLNMGAGRIVEQELKKIKDLIGSGKLFTAAPFKNAIENCLSKKSALHLMGLVQDEGVHAHQDHLFAIAAHAAKRGVKTIWVHFFSDGRDTPQRSAIGFIRETENQLKAIGAGKIGTVIGRYYAMDRSENWELTDSAYRAIVSADGRKAASAEEAINRAYASDKNPDGTPMVDEYVPPTVLEGYPGVKAGDSVIHINFRQDRAIQLTKAFVENDYPGKRGAKPDIVYCGLTRYYDSFQFNALPPMDEDSSMG